MNEIQRGIVTLVQSAITGKALSLPEGFDIEKAYPMIACHQLVTMAYTGAVQCGVSKDLPIMQKLFQIYCQCLVRVERQMHDVKRIFTAFDENGIDYLPVKGCKINALYPAPELRLMGDADILIRMEQYPEICTIMEGLGFAPGVEGAHDFVWDSKCLHVELHKSLTSTYNNDYYVFLKDTWEKAKRIEGRCHAISNEDEFIYLFIHFAKHYRGGGIGCRQLIDLWVYREAFPAMDESYIRQRLEQLCLVEFYENILRVIAVWFKGQPADEKTDFISEYIFQSGSWGNIEAHLISNKTRKVMTGNTQYTRTARWKSVLSDVFPGVNRMKLRYPIVGKIPVLLPIFWPVRWVTALLFRHHNVIHQYRAAQVVTPDKIENFQQALQYVGLGFGK